MSIPTQLEAALEVLNVSTDPRMIQLRILRFLPVALQLIEDAIAGKLGVSMELRLYYASEYMARAGFGEIKRKSAIHMDATSSDLARELAERAQNAYKAKELAAGISPREEERKGDPFYLDDDLLHAYTEFAANQHSLELVALAHFHRDYHQLSEGGYLKMKSRIQDPKRHDYVKALVEGKIKYSFATTANLSEMFGDTVSALEVGEGADA